MTRSIDAVLAGDTVLRPAVTDCALARLHALAPAFESAALPSALTARESEVLRLMASGPAPS